MEKVGAIVLAAGKGTRMKSKDVNKVAVVVNNKPLVVRTIEILRSAGIQEIVVVVGFAKESVIKVLPPGVKIAVQSEQLGTGDAARVGLEEISDDMEQVLSVYGDDSFLYTPEIFKKMVKCQYDSHYALTFATVNLSNPTGYGRIVRNRDNQIYKIVEEVNASEEERKITEVNTGCYLFNKKFLQENIGKIKKNALKSEYYLTDIVEIFVEKKYPIGSITIPSNNWRGVNTPEELKLAEIAIRENE